MLYANGASVPAWLAPRIDREIAWVDLARGAQKAAQDLSRPSWLNAAATMVHLLTVYDAERTISGSLGGVDKGDSQIAC